MAAEQPDSAAGTAENSGPALVSLATVTYALAATGGTLALLNGVDSYGAYTTGVPDPIFHLLGVVATLAVGFLLLVVALSGAVTLGVERAQA
ncbi:hypothetical protein [Salinirussus salinus]|jgi:hypothetical protein|uniref:hypothetical protein n=1 Tax=Salinirussus salinus TaxID=1198300 RepID=UPI001357CB4B|nr:hypothetical protein [Salinirussus salinus]